MDAFINEGYLRLKPFLYPCTIEFSLMSLTVSITGQISHQEKQTWSSSNLALLSYMGKYWGKLCL